MNFVYKDEANGIKLDQLCFKYMKKRKKKKNLRIFNVDYFFRSLKSTEKVL